MPAGTSAANGGRWATLHAPVATTTDRALQQPSLVVTSYPLDLGAHPGDRRAGLHRGVDDLGVPLDERDDLGHRHEAVGVGAVVAETGEPALPVRREQPQGVPPLRLPRVGDLTALQHDVVDGTGGQPVAHRQAGMTGADDYRRDVACQGGPSRRAGLSEPRP